MIIKPLSQSVFIKGDRNETGVLPKATPYVSGAHLSKWDKGVHLAIVQGLAILLFFLSSHTQKHTGTPEFRTLFLTRPQKAVALKLGFSPNAKCMGV